MRTWIDRGGCTFLPMCACGWRGLTASTYDAASLQARHHEARAHPGSHTAARAWNNYQTRRHS